MGDSSAGKGLRYGSEGERRTLHTSRLSSPPHTHTHTNTHTHTQFYAWEKSSPVRRTHTCTHYHTHCDNYRLLITACRRAQINVGVKPGGWLFVFGQQLVNTLPNSQELVNTLPNSQQLVK